MELSCQKDQATQVQQGDELQLNFHASIPTN